MVQDSKEYQKAYYQAHKEKAKAKNKAYYQTHKDERKARDKAYYQAHKDEYNARQRAYQKADVNALGKTKLSIRAKSQYYLKKHGTKIQGFVIHHCCTYNEPYKFIYCSIELHNQIHAYLREHNIDADSDHYEQIKHLLDDTVVIYDI